MDKDTFMQQVSDLRRQGASIRGIASKLGVTPSRVQRAVAKLTPPGTLTSDHNVSHADQETIFVGREEEMGLLRRKLDEAVAGHGNFVLLSGEAGIGKTRLAQELCSYAETKRVSSYWGICHEELQTPPYWPWIQIFRNYIQQNRSSRIRSEMGMAAADIAQLAPKLIQNPKILQKLPDLKPVPPLNDPSEDRFRLFDSVSSFLGRSSKRQPMLLILDNLQWCDESSLMFLRFLAQELASKRILVVGSYRNVSLERDCSLMAALGELSCQPFFRQVVLQGLNRQEAEQLIRSQEHDRASQDLMQTVYNRTEGNPLFIIHIVRSLVQEGNRTGQASEADVTRISVLPDSLYVAISRNLSYLSRRCLEILTAASALGRNFKPTLLQRIIKDTAAHELHGFLDEAVHGGIISQVDSTPGWYHFTHALVQETLLRSMTAQQKINLHARIGLVLEEVYGNNVASIASQLAYHFGESADITGPEKAIHYSQLAAENALSVFAYEEAVRQFHRALEIKRQKTPAAVYGIPDDETANITLGLVQAGAATSIWTAHNSLETVLHLFDYYLDKKDVSKIMEIGKIPIVVGDQSGLFESKKRFERIFSLLPPDSPEAGWLLCIYGYFLGTYAGECDMAGNAFERALVIARQHGDQHMELRALVNSVLVKTARWEADWDRLVQIIDMAKRLEDQQVEAIGRFYYAAFSTVTKQRSEAQALLESAMLIVTQLRHHILQNALTSTRRILAQYYGDFQTSYLHSERDITGPGRNTMDTMIKAINYYELDKFEEGNRFVKQAIKDLKPAFAGHSPEYGYAAAQLPFIRYLTGIEEWSEIEEAIINEVLSSVPPDNFLNIIAQVGLGLRAINNGNVVVAKQSYDFLRGPIKAYPERSMIPPVLMSSDRFLGLLCLASEDYDRAIKHFQDAIEICREWGFLPQLAWSCYDCSRAMLIRNKPGDHDKANTMLARALSLADELGMKLLSGRINSLHEIKVPEQASLTGSNNFTSREIEVLKLLALGKSNREIAEELFISTYTASTHVRNILSKGNLTNRTEAAALAIRYYSKQK